MYIQNQRFAIMEESIGSRFIKAYFCSSTRLYSFCVNSLTAANQSSVSCDDYSRDNSYDSSNMASMMIEQECIDR